LIDQFVGSYYFLSNFYPSPIECEGIVFPTLEHAYQAMKSKDFTIRERMSDQATPTLAKRYGKKIQLRPGWEQYWRYFYMEKLLAIKFYQDNHLAFDLLATSPQALVEGNAWHDQIWGDCFCGRTECSSPGMNLLGWMLMRQRNFLKEGL
jgi:ribA/ribD-fused uncharacterized protein